MAQSTKQNGVVGRLRELLGGGAGAHVDINEAVEDDTPWITVKNDSFVREVLKDSVVAAVVITVLTILFSELLILSGLVRFEEVVRTSDLLTVLSVLAVLVVGAAGYRTGKTTAKRAHTVALLSEAMSNDGLFTALMEVRCMSPERIARFVDRDPFDPAAELDIIRVLNFYEFVATACNSDDADANVVLKVRGEAMCDTAERFTPVIEKVRAEYSPETYKAFTNLVREYDERKAAWIAGQRGAN